MYFAAQREIIETWCVLMLGSPSLPRGIPTAVNDFEHAHRNVRAFANEYSRRYCCNSFCVFFCRWVRAGYCLLKPSDQRGMRRQRTSSVRQSEAMVSVRAPPPPGNPSGAVVDHEGLGNMWYRVSRITAVVIGDMEALQVFWLIIRGPIPAEAVY